MANQSKLTYYDQDTIYYQLLTDKNDLTKTNKYSIALPNGEDLSNNPPAKSFMSTGRDCPSCAGQLLIQEVTKDKTDLVVYCSKCGQRYFASDLESEGSDAIYRLIPKEMQLRHENRIDRSK